MKNYISKTLVLLGTMLIATSCVKDLDRKPTNDLTSEVVYSTPEGTMQALAKVYGAWSLSEGDVVGMDDGSTAFVRTFWNLQELPTDEAKCAWSDKDVVGLSDMRWDTNTGFVKGLYYRSIIQIKYANEYLKYVGNSPLSAEEKALTAAEARFIRAFQYWVLMDIFGNPPFITEADKTSKEAPKQIKRADLFNYIEKELLEIESQLKPARTHLYGRVDQGATWALLARLYLNAEVYTGKARYADAAKYAEKVITAGYSLTPEYRHLFMADNHKCTDELILTIPFDGQKAKAWGGATFLVSASYNDKILENVPGGTGTDGKWGGNRATPTFAKLFDQTEKRALLIYTTDHMNDLSDFNHGVHVYKYVNVDRSGNPGSNNEHSDLDFPLFRLAEQHLIYAEASLRDASVDKVKGLKYFNDLRQRANQPQVSTLTLRDILDERGRELYWEGHRRTDLIRFGLFTSGDYLWEWKGGTPKGTSVDKNRNLYPIPADDLLANPDNLTPNPGY